MSDGFRFEPNTVVTIVLRSKLPWFLSAIGPAAIVRIHDYYDEIHARRTNPYTEQPAKLENFSNRLVAATERKNDNNTIFRLSSRELFVPQLYRGYRDYVFDAKSDNGTVRPERKKPDNV